MDGKLLVLCGERPTINENGERIDKKGHLLINKGKKYLNKKGEEVKVNKHKQIISGMDLLSTYMTESIKPDMLFVDWETIVTSDLEPLYEMIKYAESEEIIPPELIFDAQKNESIMKKAHLDTLLQKDKHSERPSFDYKFEAMENFMQMFSSAITDNRIVSILPAYSTKDDDEINRARMKLLESLKYRMETKFKLGQGPKINVLDSIYYSDYGKVHEKAIIEMMRIISEPDWYEQSTQSPDDSGR